MLFKLDYTFLKLFSEPPCVPTIHRDVTSFSQNCTTDDMFSLDNRTTYTALLYCMRTACRALSTLREEIDFHLSHVMRSREMLKLLYDTHDSVSECGNTFKELKGPCNVHVMQHSIYIITVPFTIHDVFV